MRDSRPGISSRSTEKMGPPHWAHHWEEIAAHLSARRRLLLACDFDGTLAPITARPENAVLPEAMRALLHRFARCPGITLAIVSGRALADVRARVGIEAAIYCGNHGLEIEGPDFSWTHPEAAQRRCAMAAAVAALRRDTAELDGVLVEDKGLTATVHWRLASDEARETLRPLIAQAVEGQSGLRLAHGKAVWELRPRVDWDKGAALRHLLVRENLERADALFLGDDEADESAFRALPDGITLRVGEPGATAARFCARDVSEAAGFLFCLFASRTGRSVAPQRSIIPFPAAAAA